MESFFLNYYSEFFNELNYKLDARHADLFIWYKLNFFPTAYLMNNYSKWYYRNFARFRKFFLPDGFGGAAINWKFRFDAPPKQLLRRQFQRDIGSLDILTAGTYSFLAFRMLQDLVLFAENTESYTYTVAMFVNSISYQLFMNSMLTLDVVSNARWGILQIIVYT